MSFWRDWTRKDQAIAIYGFDTATGEFEVRNPRGTKARQYWDMTFEIRLSTLLADGDTIKVME